jgi:glucose-6-phosphate dehydrogenase assembly protein OpcA
VETLVSEDLWSEQDTSPAAIEAALRELLNQRHAQYEGYVPARVLNLVVIVDRQWKGEIANRLEKVGRYNASRTVLCAVERGRTTIDAVAAISYDVDPKPGSLAVTRENVEIDIGPQHLPVLDTIIDPILIKEVSTVVWAPHGHSEGVDALLGLADVVLLDSAEEHDVQAALGRIAQLLERVYVVDLAWLRSTPWRERIAATFDPPTLRPELRHISGLTVKHRHDSGAAALLFVGWMGSRLGWRTGAMTRVNGNMKGKAAGRRQDVQVTLDASEMSVPGLEGVTIETASGLEVSLSRGPGGLTARRRRRDGREWTWRIVGASRGEGGILGEGVRQALLRDHTYGPALDAARSMLP